MFEVERRQVLRVPPLRMSGTEEAIFENWVGPLDGERSIWVECSFADPIADVALLREPDHQLIAEQCLQFRKFASKIEPLQFGLDKPSSVWVLELSGEWREASGISVDGNSIWGDPRGDFTFEGGMSGSPILDGAGKAVGFVSTDGSCPRLPHTLPRWFLELVEQSLVEAPG